MRRCNNEKGTAAKNHIFCGWPGNFHHFSVSAVLDAGHGPENSGGDF
jgi:hypothetical protein